MGTTCPNDCSGHGQCRTDANSFYYIGQTPKVPYGTQIPAYSRARGASTWGIHWPLLKYQQCHCDAGYEGDDCSLRRCPRGDDPETECNTDRGEDIQRLTCKFAKKDGKDLEKAFFQLRFTDQFGGEYDTRPIKVDFDDTSKTDPKIDVKFTDGHNTGKQQLLIYKATAPCTSGSQPLFRTTVTAGDLT